MVNATPASLGLLSNGLDAARFQLSNATSHVDFLYQLARQRDGRRVCHYRRSSRLVEEVEGTAEVAGHFYRRAVGCNSFDMQAGMPFVAFVIASPDSKEAAVAPSSGIASVHTFFRLFANFRGTSGPVLDEGDGIKWDKPDLQQQNVGLRLEAEGKNLTAMVVQCLTAPSQGCSQLMSQIGMPS